MKPHKRYLLPFISEDLAKKMVFLGGPRQVGKTTFALSLLQNSQRRHPAYFNWDIDSDRKKVRAEELPFQNEPLIILDEIHKYARWRNLVKGYYDRYSPETSFLVTGSARLDYYRKGGDSLHGRYHYYRLHPFSIGELSSKPSKSDVQQLLRFGGFPEPALDGTERNWKRWQKERITRVIYDDLRDLERVQELSLIEVLVDALPERVASPLSVKSLREDLQVAHQSVERWLTILENLYFCFRISPFGAAKIRAVKKERKLYFWDWSQSPEGGPRFENMLASHLLKYCHFLEDTEGDKMELRFLRDIDKREVDFVVLRNRKPIFAVECRTGEKQVSRACRYFRERTPIPEFYQVHLGTADYGDATKDVRVLPFAVFCREKNLP